MCFIYIFVSAFWCFGFGFADLTKETRLFPNVHGIFFFVVRERSTLVTLRLCFACAVWVVVAVNVVKQCL